MPPRVAITLGDPRGIGPEVIAKTLSDPPARADYVVIGPAGLMGGFPGVERIAVGGKGEGGRGKGAGRLAGQAVEKAVELAMRGAVDAVVTGPAEKAALHEAGYRHPGHTEWLAELAGGGDVAMMLVAGSLRVVLVTTHMPISEVVGAITEERVLTAGRLTRDALQTLWEIPEPRLAICALNPHAGEGGLFGAEDQTILAPAAKQLCAEGPLPADTVFVRALKGEFDAVLAPYHDVGMTAVKVAGFGRGVNVTLGLPFIRTAPDHGTAFDIAGKGVADPGSMREAVRLAVDLAGKRIIRGSA